MPMLSSRCSLSSVKEILPIQTIWRLSKDELELQLKAKSALLRGLWLTLALLPPATELPVGKEAVPSLQLRFACGLETDGPSGVTIAI